MSWLLAAAVVAPPATALLVSWIVIEPYEWTYWLALAGIWAGLAAAARVDATPDYPPPYIMCDSHPMSHSCLCRECYRGMLDGLGGGTG